MCWVFFFFYFSQYENSANHGVRHHTCISMATHFCARIIRLVEFHKSAPERLQKVIVSLWSLAGFWKEIAKRNGGATQTIVSRSLPVEINFDKCELITSDKNIFIWCSKSNSSVENTDYMISMTFYRYKTAILKGPRNWCQMNEKSIIC